MLEDQSRCRASSEWRPSVAGETHQPEQANVSGHLREPHCTPIPQGAPVSLEDCHIQSTKIIHQAKIWVQIEWWRLQLQPNEN